MALDLEKLRGDVEAYLQEKHLPVFYGYDQTADGTMHVAWNTELHPDFKEFVDCAVASGVKLMVVHIESFSESNLDEAIDQLEICDFTAEEKRSIEKRIKALRGYEGFTSLISLSFTLENRIYQFELHSEWHDALEDIWLELDSASNTMLENGDDEGPVGGYFSNN